MQILSFGGVHRPTEHGTPRLDFGSPDLITTERGRACVRFLVGAGYQHIDRVAGRPVDAKRPDSMAAGDRLMRHPGDGDRREAI